MRRTILACRLVAASFVLCAAEAGATDYSGGQLRKNDNTWNNLNAYYMMHAANAFGPSYDMAYFEIEGGARSAVLDLYYFFDVNHIFGWGTYYKDAGNFFTKIKPRFSLDALLGRDLSAGPVKEWYFAAQYKGFNGGEYYSAGVGTDMDVPGIDFLQVNFWPKYVRFSEENKMSYAGLELSLNWYKTLRRCPSGAVLSYQGWLDYGFSNVYSIRQGGSSTGDEFQMFNGFFLTKGHWSGSLDVKLHRHLSYSNANAANNVSFFVGGHYKL